MFHRHNVHLECLSISALLTELSGTKNHILCSFFLCVVVQLGATPTYLAIPGIKFVYFTLESAFMASFCLGCMRIR